MGLTNYFVIINYDISPNRKDWLLQYSWDSTRLVSNAYGWLCKEAVKVSIKMAACRVSRVHGRKSIRTWMYPKQAQKPCDAGRQGAMKAASGGKIGVNVKMSASVVAR